MKRALLMGATGLVGRHLLHDLLESSSYERVVTLGRRPLGVTHPRLDDRVIDFDDLYDEVRTATADDVFCCLGTTIKQAGSREAFRQVDLHYPVKAARAAEAAGAAQFLVVSSLGASPSAWFFYSRVKGEMEEAVKAAGLPSVWIFQPSLLTGDRDEERPGEDVAARFFELTSFLWRGPLARYRPVEARTVAAAMLAAAERPAPGMHVAEPTRIRVLARPE